MGADEASPPPAESARACACTLCLERASARSLSYLSVHFAFVCMSASLVAPEIERSCVCIHTSVASHCPRRVRRISHWPAWRGGQATGGRGRVRSATMPPPLSTPDHLLVHFIFGLSDEPTERAFTYAHYVAVRAAHLHMQPASLLLHHHHLPTGAWWSEAQKLLELRRVELPRTIFGRPLVAAAHRADVLRLQLLIAHGGLYLDLDVIVLRPMHNLLRGTRAFVIGREGHAGHGGLHGLCNAVLLAHPNASFARRWLAEYHDFGTSGATSTSAVDPWSEHSVQRPVALAARHPDEIHVLPYKAFFWPDWDEDQLQRLLLLRTDPLTHLQRAVEVAQTPSVAQAPGADLMGGREYGPHEEPPSAAAGYGVHLWSSRGGRFVLDLWEPEYMSSVPSSLNCILRQSLAPLPYAPLPHAPLPHAPLPHALPPLPDGLERGCACGVLNDAAGGSASSMIAHWPLRRSHAGASPRLLTDASGHCHHGWVYSHCGRGGFGARPLQPPWASIGPDDFLKREHVHMSSPSVAAANHSSAGITDLTDEGCWAPPLRSGEGLDGAPTLSSVSALEAFIPLPSRALSGGEWTLSWRASVHSRRAQCGGRVPFWALKFADGAVMSASAESLGTRHLVPVVRWVGRARRGLYPLISRLAGHGDVELRADGASVCNNGWHHYTLVASTRRLSLYLDGEVWATTTWHWPRGTGGADGDDGLSVEGIWVGGDAIARIANRAPFAHAGPGDAEHAVGIAELALLHSAVTPEALPRSLRRPSTDGSGRGALGGPSVRARAEMSVLVGAVQWVGFLIGGGSHADPALCPACNGRMESASASLFALPAWTTRRRGAAADAADGGENAPGQASPTMEHPTDRSLRAATAMQNYLVVTAIGIVALMGVRAHRRSRRGVAVLGSAVHPRAAAGRSPGETPFKQR